MTGRTPPADGAGCAGRVSSAHEPAYLSLVLHLPYQSPWEWRQFHQHFALRLLAGVESLGDDHYARSFRANGRPAWFEVRPLAERQVLALSLSPSAHALAAELEARVRRMFDLDSDPAAIARHFAGDPLLGPLVAANPGLRLPVAFDPFEQAVRAIVGQQVTVKAAVTITGRLIQRLGEPLENLGYDGISHLFPTPAALAQANLDGIGMPGKRVQTLQRFAAAIASGELSLDLADGPEALVERLCALPGIGPWTAEYIALRAMGEADAFPAADLGLLKSTVWGRKASMRAASRPAPRPGGLGAPTPRSTCGTTTPQAASAAAGGYSLTLPRGPAMAQMIRPSTGRTMITRTQMIFIAVSAVLFRMLTMAQISRARMTRLISPLRVDPMARCSRARVFPQDSRRAHSTTMSAKLATVGWPSRLPPSRARPSVRMPASRAASSSCTTSERKRISAAGRPMAPAIRA